MSDQQNGNEPQVDENELIRQRRDKLDAWRHSHTAYPNTFKPEDLAEELEAKYGDLDKEELDSKAVSVSVAGRMMSRRIMGKASFAHLQDRSGRIQIYLQRDSLPEGFYNEEFKKWDIGDIVAATGVLFKTNKGELSVKVSSVELLVRSNLLSAALRWLDNEWAQP